MKFKKENIHEKDIFHLAWSFSDDIVLTTSADKKIKFWNPNNGENVKVLVGHQEIVCNAAWNPVTNNLYSGGIDNYIIIWNKSGECVRIIKK